MILGVGPANTFGYNKANTCFLHMITFANMKHSLFFPSLELFWRREE